MDQYNFDYSFKHSREGCTIKKWSKNYTCRLGLFKTIKFYFMKRVIVVLLLLASTSLNILLANDGGVYVTPQAKRTLAREFPGAKFDHWEALKDDNMYVVRFVYNEQALLAYISEEGSMIATIRSSTRESLPFMVNEMISRRYRDFSISKIEEIVTPGDVSYLFWVENNSKSILLRVYSNGNVHEIRKEKRKAANPSY